ncbi:hypothetical protein, partial [Mesorhizobium sp.]|uniref:hypothetical protein n=1 Tax=Mesorhizobium sp. TaxID=1871066 RepID=UPI0025BA761C
ANRRFGGRIVRDATFHGAKYRDGRLAPLLNAPHNSPPVGRQTDEIIAIVAQRIIKIGRFAEDRWLDQVEPTKCSIG